MAISLPFKGIATSFLRIWIHGNSRSAFLNTSSFPGSFNSPPKRDRGKKEPGSGRSYVSQKVGGDEKKTNNAMEGLISNSVKQIQSWSHVLMFDKFYGWQSCGLGSIFCEKEHNFLTASLVESFLIGLNWHLCFTLYNQTFLSEARTINCPASLIDAQVIGKTDNNTLNKLW